MPNSKCKLCGKETNIRFNINFEAVPVCDSCANQIVLQQVQDLVRHQEVDYKRILCRYIDGICQVENIAYFNVVDEEDRKIMSEAFDKYVEERENEQNE